MYCKILRIIKIIKKGGSVGDSGAKFDPKPSQGREKDTKEDKTVKTMCSERDLISGIRLQILHLTC